MLRNVSRGLAAAVLVAAVTVTAAGCSISNTKTCNKITQDINDISSKTSSQVSDPSAMAKTYRDGAAKIRKDGEDGDGDVKAAADKAASAMEGLADSVAAAVSSGKAPDTQPLIDAGKDLKAACS